MPPLPPFIEARNTLSPRVNGVFVPFKSIVDAVRRFCTPAFFHSDDPIFDISKSGSALQIRYRGRNLVLCTRHQLGSGTFAYRPEQYTVTFVESTERKVGLSPNVVSKVRMKHAEHSNLEDMLLLEYENERAGRNLRLLFLDLDLNRTLETVPPASVKAIFAIGYPTVAGDVDVEYDCDGNPIQLTMELRWTKLYLALDAAALLDTENRRPMVPDPRSGDEAIDPDGMSGAPVFFIYLDDRNEAHLGFAGMITDARKERYMVYDGALIRQVVDAYIDA